MTAHSPRIYKATHRHKGWYLLEYSMGDVDGLVVPLETLFGHTWIDAIETARSWFEFTGRIKLPCGCMARRV